ncbi:DUF6153 family protein [Streptomyces sp. NPDC004980]
MTIRSRSGSRPAGRLFVLLVLAVLAGVLGMHGLAPGGVPQARTMAGHETGHERGTTPADDVPHADAGCAHADGGPGHLHHADGTCAAAATSSAYAPPAPAGAVSATPAAPSPTAAASGNPHVERAPPDLSELQLLRI